MSKSPLLRATILSLILMLAACNMPGTAPSAAEQTALINTSVARTVAAGLPDTQEADSPQPDDPSETPETEPEETEPPPATDTPEPDTATPSDTPIPCNLARFVKDVTIPDGEVFAPGDTFTKTWRLKNLGSCAWTTGYEIVFSGGDAMGAPSSVSITSGTVNPGQNVDVSVDLTAPADAGTYRGNWKLRDPSDVVFGIENSSSGLFWVEIEVVEPTDTPEPQTVTLHRSNKSKTISVGGMSSDTRAGIAGNGDPLRGFIDYDLSTLSGLSDSSTIDSATLDVSDHDGFSCFDFLHPLKAGVVDFGTVPDYPSDFNQTPSAMLFEVPSALGISGPITITDELQDFVSAQGAGRFQIKIWLDGDDAGSGFACLMEFFDPIITVTYTP